MDSLVDFLSRMGVWNWIFLGLLLGVLEAIIPGVYFLWFGIAALIVGVLAGAAQSLGFGDVLTWPWQLVLFAVISLASVLWLRTLLRPDGRSDLPNLNVRGAQYVGRTAVVEEAIVGGRGKVRVGDTIWSAQGADAPVGSNIRIVGIENTVLTVEPA